MLRLQWDWDWTGRARDVGGVTASGRSVTGASVRIAMGEAKPTVLTVSDMHCSSCGEPCGGQGHLVIDDVGSYKSCEEPERWQRQLKRAELRRDIRRALAERVSVGRSSDRYLIGGVARELLTRALNEMGGSRG